MESLPFVIMAVSVILWMLSRSEVPEKTVRGHPKQEYLDTSIRMGRRLSYAAGKKKHPSP